MNYFIFINRLSLMRLFTLLLSFCLATASVNAATGFEPGQDVGEGWYDSTWFGPVWTGYAPWVYAEGTGWAYTQAAGDSALYVHTQGTGWLYTDAGLYPAFYRFDTGSWLHSFGAEGDGWFYDYQMADYWNRDRVPDALSVLLRQRLDEAGPLIAATAAAMPDTETFPVRYDEGWVTAGSWDWTSGFWPGCLWFMYEYTGDPAWRTQAEQWTVNIEDQKSNDTTHDLGFMFGASFVQAYRLTGVDYFREVAVEAATTLNTRYSDTVGAMRSWSWGGFGESPNFTVIIDNMMNLELGFWAADFLDGDTAWTVNGLQHARTTATEFFHEDGSCYHVVIFDEADGSIIQKRTWQGYADESAWARGQAWAIYGYTVCYRETGESDMLAMARTATDYFVDNLPADHVPFWDFENPGIPYVPRDSSAASIAASALVELSSLVDDPVEAASYRDAAANILASLSSDAYFDVPGNGTALIAHGTTNGPRGSDDHAIIFGDYYYLEAAIRYLRMTGWMPATSIGNGD